MNRTILFPTNQTTLKNPVSDGEDDSNSTDSDTSIAAEEVTHCIDEIRREVLEGIKLVPFHFCPPRPPNVVHLNLRIKKQCHYTTVQQRWKKDRGEVVRDILDGKDPFAAAIYSEGTTDCWTGLFSRERPPLPDDIFYGEADILGLILQEIVWLMTTTNCNSPHGPDGLKAMDFIAIPNEKLASAYNQYHGIGLSSKGWQAARTTLIPKVDNPASLGDFYPITANDQRPA